MLRVFRSWFDLWVEQRHQLQQLERGASSASRGDGGVGTRRPTCWSACTHDPQCLCRSARAGRPAPFARPASKQASVRWSYTRSRRGAPAGLEGAGLHDQLVLDGEPLTPRRYQNRQGARQFAVFLQDQKWRRALLARVALIRHIVSSRNRIYPRCLVLYVPRKHPYSYIYAKVCINEYIYATYI